MSKMTKTNKSRKNSVSRKARNTSNKFEREIACKFLQMLNTVKLYHWKTYSYPTHKATDELYSKLGDNIDKFIEVLLGKFNNRINLTTIKSLPLRDVSSPEEFKREIISYKNYLVGLSSNPGMKSMSNTDLFNIRDEMLGDLNQFLYLFTFR